MVELENVDLEKRLTVKKLAIGLGTLVASGLGILVWRSSRDQSAPLPVDPVDVPQVENYLNSLIGAERPEPVRELVYDTYEDRRFAIGAAKSFARTEALRYYMRFNEPNILNDLVLLMKDSDLWKGLTEGQARKGIRNFLASHPSRQSLHDLIEEHLYKNLLKQISERSAVAIPISQSDIAPKPQYRIYVFPQIFEPYDVEVNGEGRKVTPNARDIKATILGAYFREELRSNPNKR